MLSRVRLFTTPWTIACRAPLSIGFSRQEYWSRLPFPSPGDLPDPGVEPRSPHCRQILYRLSHQRMRASQPQWELPNAAGSAARGSLGRDPGTKHRAQPLPCKAPCSDMESHLQGGQTPPPSTSMGNCKGTSRNKAKVSRKRERKTHSKRHTA